jgi:hypothetical protein
MCGSSVAPKLWWLSASLVFSMTLGIYKACGLLRLIVTHYGSGLF